jgi:hypothetical protein
MIEIRMRGDGYYGVHCSGQGLVIDRTFTHVQRWSLPPDQRRRAGKFMPRSKHRRKPGGKAVAHPGRDKPGRPINLSWLDRDDGGSPDCAPSQTKTR